MTACNPHAKVLSCGCKDCIINGTVTTAVIIEPFQSHSLTWNVNT